MNRLSGHFLVVALVFPTVMAWLYFAAAAPAIGEHSANPAMQALYVVGKVVQFSLPLAVWWLTDRDRLRIRKPNWTALTPALAFGLLSALGIVGVYFAVLKGHSLLAGMPEQIRLKIAALGIGSPSRYLWFAAFVSFLHAFLEEYYWRGYVFDALKTRMRLSAAIALSSLAFMAHHVVILHVYSSGRFWTGTLPLSLGVALGGVVWAWIYHRAGSVAPGWISHAIIDLAIMAVGYDMAFR